ncbi:MAG: hypothetical protein H6P99_1484 [Holophagaceae bacterium]|nr:hypothetical protein [Holophagaceae bacterium]
MPARLIRLAFWPMPYSGMKASPTLTGMVMMGTRAEGTCHRKMRMMIETMIISSMSLCFTVLMEFSMSSERS